EHGGRVEELPVEVVERCGERTWLAGRAAGQGGPPSGNQCRDRDGRPKSSSVKGPLNFLERRLTVRDDPARGVPHDHATTLGPSPAQRGTGVWGSFPGPDDV